MLFSLSMFPIGVGDEIAHPVAEVVDEIEKAGLVHRVTAMDTQIEGRWEEVMPVIRRAQQRLLDEHPRVFFTLSVDEHIGVPPIRLQEAVDDIKQELAHEISR